jgi:hypothetical protein
MRLRALKFQERRKWFIGRLHVPSIIVLLIAVLALLLKAHDWLTYLLFGASIALGIFGELTYRCPVCRRIPTVGEGLDLDPEVCGHCGTILKWRD